MKPLFVVAALLVSLLFVVQPVYAHVLLLDQTHTKGAILHITPDDDPIAGQVATIYFDTQGLLAKAGSSAVLTVRDGRSQTTHAKLAIDSTVATATYTFPTQGVYTLTFTVKSEGKTYTFTQSQRISRGITAGTRSEPPYTWAEMVLLSVGICFAILVIFAVNHRKAIAKHSSF